MPKEERASGAGGSACQRPSRGSYASAACEEGRGSVLGVARRAKLTKWKDGKVPLGSLPSE